MADVTPERLADCIEVARQEAESFAAHGHGRTRIKADALAALCELAELREQVRWRPMEEAPTDGTPILAFWRLEATRYSAAHTVIRWRLCEWVYADSPHHGVEEPAGWMPLPDIGPLPGGDV